MIAIGCDHGGYELKEKILAHLQDRGLEYRDFGCDSPLRWIIPSTARRWPVRWQLANAIKASSSAAPASASPSPPQSARHPLCPVRGLLLRPGHPATQQRQCAGSGGAGHRSRPGAGDRGHLPGHAFFEKEAPSPGIPAGGRKCLNFAPPFWPPTLPLWQRMCRRRSPGADAFHIDIMDGHFVPAISFGNGMVGTMGRLTGKPLDVHLMVENPLDFLPELAELGVNGSRSITRSRVGRKRLCGPSVPPECTPGWCLTPKRRWKQPCRIWQSFRGCC